MPIFQPPVPPLPPNFSLTGQIAVVTGSTSGIGLSTARLLLSHGCSEVILAVRSPSKAQSLLTSSLLPSTSTSTSATPNQPDPPIRILPLDVESIPSVLAFTKTLLSTTPHLNLLILNAGFHRLDFHRTETEPKRERGLVGMYLANVVLSAALLPLMRKTVKEGKGEARITWVGSRLGTTESFTSVLGEGKKVGWGERLWEGQNLVDRFDDESVWNKDLAYGDVKLLGLAWVQEMGRRMEIEGKGNGDVKVNIVCPGMIRTAIADVLPWYFRWIVALVLQLRGRQPDVGGGIIVHAAAVAKGKEVNGAFFHDKEIGKKEEWYGSVQGRDFVERLWRDTVEEVEKLVDVPVEWLE